MEYSNCDSGSKTFQYTFRRFNMQDTFIHRVRNEYVAVLIYIDTGGLIKCSRLVFISRIYFFGRNIIDFRNDIFTVQSGFKTIILLFPVSHI